MGVRGGAPLETQALRPKLFLGQSWLWDLAEPDDIQREPSLMVDARVLLPERVWHFQSRAFRPLAGDVERPADPVLDAAEALLQVRVKVVVVAARRPELRVLLEHRLELRIGEDLHAGGVQGRLTDGASKAAPIALCGVAFKERRQCTGERMIDDALGLREKLLHPIELLLEHNRDQFRDAAAIEHHKPSRMPVAVQVTQKLEATGSS